MKVITPLVLISVTSALSNLTAMAAEEEEDFSIKGLTHHEVTAITEKNCSVAYLDDGAELPPEVLSFPCRVALWFQGEYPDWIQTSNIIKEMESATKEQLEEFAPAVCECRIIDVGELCEHAVRLAAQKIIDLCPLKNKMITSLTRQGSVQDSP